MKKYKTLNYLTFKGRYKDNGFSISHDKLHIFKKLLLSLLHWNEILPRGFVLIVEYYDQSSFRESWFNRAYPCKDCEIFYQLEPQILLLTDRWH